jgi:hypothetical protein
MIKSTENQNSRAPSFCDPESYITSSPDADVCDCIDAINAALIRANAVTHMTSLLFQTASDENRPSDVLLAETLWSISGQIDQAKIILGILNTKIRTNEIEKSVVINE